MFASKMRRAHVHYYRINDAPPFSCWAESDTLDEIFVRGPSRTKFHAKHRVSVTSDTGPKGGRECLIKEERCGCHDVGQPPAGSGIFFN